MIICKREINTDIENKWIDTKGGQKGWDELGDWDRHIHTIDMMYKTDK